MGSSYFGEPNMGNERGGGGSSSSSSSSRKGKKSNSDKPKQPQRGLGVAQLEKIRLHGQIASNYHPSFHTTPYPTTNFNQEDMRVQTAYSSMQSSSFSYSSTSSASPTSYGYHPTIPMGLGDYERSTIVYGDHSQPTTPTARSWNPGSGIIENQHFVHPSMNRHLLNLHNVEDPQPKKNKKHRSSSLGSSSQNSESSDTQDVDLELRLSL
ncbi:hypothetical protein LWI29_027515 [Acer saccharum]|uniref:Uncharacterized protein n=1 Tax=Acer saccharum TaxID=4024 RepID=A0AA39VBU8_ACESA|nr:hypothetical protein LWI29_027515 [Acer saccharum]KAK1551119.1 hypothetical protein Q3G72_030600 [Acer saccharum]